MAGAESCLTLISIFDFESGEFAPLCPRLMRLSPQIGAALDEARRALTEMSAVPLSNAPPVEIQGE